MNNLQLIQEAALYAGLTDATNLHLDFGCLSAVVIRATGGWYVMIVGDEVWYTFTTMAEALDFVADEARMAAA